ncbi:MAG: dimethyl sulfoxide reductase anchor subunit [Anaerolineae bacterium]|nr:dimethyl sulfoxide reductase anchor subunit [Anaerolineae bacterium]
MELIRPAKQKVWGWPGVANFALGGAGAGSYLLAELAAALLQGGGDPARLMVFRLVGPILVGLGFLVLAVETDHPLRGRYLLRHLHRSWMSRESLAGLIFTLTAFLSWLFPHQVLEGMAAVAALGLLISHGFILYRAVAVAAWNVPLMPALFVTSGLAMGGGLLLLITSNGPDFGLAAMVLASVVSDLAAWFLYLYGPRSASFRQATSGLRRPAMLFFTVGVGHLLPATLLTLSLTGLWGKERYLGNMVAGFCALAGGVGQKTGITLKAGYLRSIRMEGLQSDAEGRGPVFPFWLPPIGNGGESDGA